MKSNYGSLNKLIKSFGYAFRGLADLIKSEQNAKIHLLITILVITAGFIFKINATEWCIVLLCIAIVFSTEALNTSVEKIIDHLFKDKNFEFYHHDITKFVHVPGLKYCAFQIYKLFEISQKRCRNSNHIKTVHVIDAAAGKQEKQH